MAFDWLTRFQHQMDKDPAYAEKTLAAYELGMKAKGSIVGVAVEPGPDSCDLARRLPAGRVYQPSEAPRLPLPECPQGRRCGCVYRPVMRYQLPDEPREGAPSGAAPVQPGDESATLRMATNPLIVVVGADGFVGGGLASALQAERVVYGPTRDGDTHVSQAEEVLKRADVVVNCGGFRVRPGCTYPDYQRSHEGSTAAFVPWIRRGALLLHTSSVSVLGRGQGLGNWSLPNPNTFPSPAYAKAKLEEDRYLEKASAEHDFRVIFLRPAVIYSAQGAGMVDTLLKLAKRGITLHLYPRDARHHLVHMDLLADVARRVIQRDDLPNLSCLVVADPYTVTNGQLEAMIRPALRRGSIPVPLPVHWMSALLRYTFHSRNPKLDLKTKGEIFGVLAMDTVYDPSETFRLLGIDPAQYSLEKTLQTVIAESLSK
jgi:nucleoside-diphosphate-sugar epimerase